jgi:predicted chitinase
MGAKMISFDGLKGLDAGATLKSLSKTAFRDLQRALAFLTYTPGKIDGAYGTNTANAWAMFKHDIGEAPSEDVNATALAGLDTRTTAFDELLSGPAPDKAAVQAAIVAACKAAGLGLKAQQAYVLATAEWETNHTFKPVREAYWLPNAETWRKAHLAYYPYYGRGYVQLTWRDNYDKYGRILGLDLVANPDLALDHYGATFVIVQGFKTGAFTGHKLSEYVNAHGSDFKAARFCINGQDKAQDIADLAEAYLKKL